MTTDTIEGLSLADAIRHGIKARGDQAAEVVAWLAEHGRPGVPPQRVYDVLRRDGRPVGKPRPARPAGTAGKPTRAQAARAQAAEAGRLADAWARQAPPVGWRSDAEGIAQGEACGKCGGPMHWTGAGTMLVCLPCHHGRRSRRAEQAAAEAVASWAPRPKVTRRAPTRAERDQISRQAHAQARQLGRIITRARELKNLTPEALDTLAWYEREVRAAEALPDQGEALTRLGQLEADLAGETLPRRRWWNLPAAVADLATADLDAEQIEALADDIAEQLADQAADRAQAEGIEAPAPPTAAEVVRFLLAQVGQLGEMPVLGGGTTTGRQAIEGAPVPASGVLCEHCHQLGRQRGAVARIYSPDAPWAVPERDVCLQHYSEAAEVITRMTYTSLVILRHYSAGGSVRPIARGPAARPAIMGEVIR